MLLDETGRTLHFEVCPCTEGYPVEACICGSLYTIWLEDKMARQEAKDDLGNGN